MAKEIVMRESEENNSHGNIAHFLLLLHQPNHRYQNHLSRSFVLPTIAVHSTQGLEAQYVIEGLRVVAYFVTYRSQQQQPGNSNAPAQNRLQ